MVSEHRPSVYGVLTDHDGWAYRTVCACGAHTQPGIALSWGTAMVQAGIHVRLASGVSTAHVAAFRTRLGLPGLGL